MSFQAQARIAAETQMDNPRWITSSETLRLHSRYHFQRRHRQARLAAAAVGIHLFQHWGDSFQGRLALTLHRPARSASSFAQPGQAVPGPGRFR